MLKWPRDCLGVIRSDGWALSLAEIALTIYGIALKKVIMSQKLVGLALRLVGRALSHAGVSPKLIG